MSKNIWELDFSTFKDTVRAIRAPQYSEDYFRLGKMHQTGCHYYIHLDENLNVINPYTKKDSGKNILKKFVSTMSREDALRQAYRWILEYAAKNELYDARYYVLTFSVWYRRGGYPGTVSVPFAFPYNGNNRCFFDNVRDEIGSNGTDIESIELISQEVHYN